MPDANTPLLSIVVPTYQEVRNIPLLCEAVHDALSDADYEYEIVFVDDNSSDGTDEICAQLAGTYPLRLITRYRNRGLSPAVLRGFREAKGPILLVMDCDLSHPATVIPAMVDALRSGQADFVVGSRYVDGASMDQNWGWFRRLNSQVPSLLSRPLSPLRDPMSGYFALHRENLPEWHRLSPIGYKIGLEIFVKGNFRRPLEIPIHFSDRRYGNSKLCLLEQLRFLRHLRRLYHYHYPVSSEFIQFGMVGASGFMIDVLIFYALQWLFGLQHGLARALSFVVAASWNWMLNRGITFSSRRKTAKRKQWMTFLATSLLGFSVNWGTYMALTSGVAFFERFHLLALVIGVLAGMGLNFMMARFFVFKPFIEDIESECRRSDEGE